MSVRLITLTIVGFLLGAFAAGGVGVRVIREVRSVDDATSLPAQNIARPDGYHVDPNETLISSVALVPNPATIDDEGLTISYDLTSLAPSLNIVASDAGPVLYPKRWRTDALGGEFEGLQGDPNDPTVVFPLLAGGTMDQIDTVNIVEAFIAAPFEVLVSVDADDPIATVIDGVQVEFVGETDDGEATTIEVRILADSDRARSVLVVGGGPGWYPAILEGDIAFLTREKDGNLDNDTGRSGPFDLVVYGTYWAPVEGEYVVNIGAAGE